MSLVFLRHRLHEYDCALNHQNIHLANIATIVAMNTLARLNSFTQRLFVLGPLLL